MCTVGLCPELTCWWGHGDGCAHHPSVLCSHQAPHETGSCQVSGGECKVNRTHTKALPNPSDTQPKNQWFPATEQVLSSAPHCTDSLLSCVTSCCVLSQENFLSHYGKALAIPFSRSPGYNEKASSGFKAGGFSLLPRLRTKYY